MAGPVAQLDVFVEFEDVDAYRIAHHSKLVCYLERARLRLLGQLGLPLEPGPRAYPVMYDLRLRFRKPARLGDHLTVTAALAGMDDFRVELKYRVRREGELLLRASSVVAFWDPEADRPVPIPAELAALREGVE